MNIDISGKVVIVTGGCSGIGEGIAKGFANEGCFVAIWDMSDDERVKDEIIASGGNAVLIKTNVTDEESVKEAVKKTLEAFNGRIDVLINCAGLAKNPSQIWNMDVSDFKTTVDVDLNGLFITSKAVVNTMREQRYGRIINIASSVAIRITQHSGVAYTAAKAGALGFTRHLAVELAAYGITVNSVSPGGVATPLTKKVWDEATLRQRESMVPVGRLATPHDIFLGCFIFAADEMSMFNAQNMMVDGGSIYNYFDNRTYHEKMGDPLPDDLH